jgi:hypothetical protein|tara:strand:+ start:2536 stop:2652 length:117 start_codon:yes stop_codon:yes gene_type:complete
MCPEKLKKEEMIKAKEPTSTEVVTGPIVSNEDAYATSP